MKFDIKTHHRSAKTGQIKRATPYRLHIKNGVQVFEREGKFYHPNGEEIVEQKKEAEKPKAEAPKAQAQEEKKEAKDVRKSSLG